MIEKLIEQEMEEYLDAAYADYGSTKNCLQHFANAVLDLAIKNSQNFLEDMVKIKCSNQQIYGASQVIEVVKDMKVKV